MTEGDVTHADRLGVIPFGDGSCTIGQMSSHRIARIIEHYFSGHQYETPITCQNQHIDLELQQSREDEILEWLEIIFTEEK